MGIYSIIEKKEYELYLEQINFKQQFQEICLKYKNKKILLYGIGKFFHYINDNYNLKSLNIVGIYDKKFKDTTMEYYQSYRICKIKDIISLNPDIIFWVTPFKIGSIQKSLSSELKNFKNKIKLFPDDSILFKKKNYKIISLGQNCLPRVYTTYSKIKPTKIYGEMTCPFDLSQHNNIDSIINILETNFRSYFEGLEFSSKDNFFINEKIQANYVHDLILNKNEFINIYKKRIFNFQEYLKSNKHIIFILSTVCKITVEQIYELKNLLNKLRG